MSPGLEVSAMVDEKVTGKPEMKLVTMNAPGGQGQSALNHLVTG